MRMREERDDQTVTITIALGLFAVTVVIASVILGLLGMEAGRSGYALVTIVAGALAITNLVRTSKR